MNMLPAASKQNQLDAQALGQRLNRKLTREEIRHEVMIRRGLFSAEDIATIIGNGATRNSVIGIWYRERKRLGLPSIARAASPVRKPKADQKVVLDSKRPPAPVRKAPPASHTEPVTLPPPPPLPEIKPLRQRLFELADDGCRHILAEPSVETLYCGLKTARGSFCAGHAQLNYSRGQVRKPDAAKPGPKVGAKKFSVFSLRAI